MFGFTGEETDSNGLVNLRARYYNPALGQFFNLDSLEGNARQPLSLDRYAYVQGNPINATDPSGRYFWFWFGNNPSELVRQYARNQNLGITIQLLYGAQFSSYRHAEYPLDVQAAKDLGFMVSSGLESEELPAFDPGQIQDNTGSLIGSGFSPIEVSGKFLHFTTMRRGS